MAETVAELLQAAGYQDVETVSYVAGNLDVDFEPEVYHIFRGISATGAYRPGPGGGYFPVQEVNEYISSFLRNGFRLFSTHYAGREPEGIMMLYVLVRG